jgi:squalene-associated FAD-dependent desaturase
MMDLEQSYAYAEQISRSSGSSFFRSFQFLKSDRRRAMHALYAFARIADDATDDATDDAAYDAVKKSSDGWATPNMRTADDRVNASRKTMPWQQASWLDWLQRLQGPDGRSFTSSSAMSSPSSSPSLPEDLQLIVLALADTVQRYKVPVAMLESLVHGMDMDARGTKIDSWQDLREYAFRVASSIGVCCTAIWTDGNPIEPGQPLWRSAVDCGVAFQLTNILRDIKEDAARGRVYLPLEDLERFGISRSQWIDSLTAGESLTTGVSTDRMSPDAVSKLIAMQIERARGLFAQGWQLHRMLDSDSFRMFSLMWHTYRCILGRIEKEPMRILRERVRLGRSRKLKLAANHCFTPILVRVASKTDRDTHWIEQIAAPKWIERKPRVAVVGGGLAGMNAAFHLGRHGCETVLFEAKSRLGGRAGSFLDPATHQPIDYCQHVGMQCCTELKRWITWTGAEDSWRTLDTLHFVSKHGKSLSVRAWPFPAPLHLSGLIVRWPDLSWIDRLRVAAGLSRLIIAKSTPSFDQMPATQWLKSQYQNQRTIDRFWATILVSALGEQVDRVAMGPVKKVLVDGFAATRDAFHLLVPTQPLSRLVDEAPRSPLASMDVDIRCGVPVHGLMRTSTGNWRIEGDESREFDAVVIATPWHRVATLLHGLELAEESIESISHIERLEASPITGVHTWWDRPWLNQPHAILIDRLCQWVFPGPEATTLPSANGETYYQIVISGSRSLPRGDHETVLQAVQQDLKELFPEARKANMLRGKVVTDPQSVFSVAPGHAASRLSSTALAREGIFLGGDWIDTGWPATMEGALRSGCLAAQNALAFLGRPAKWFD